MTRKWNLDQNGWLMPSAHCRSELYISTKINKSLKCGRKLNGQETQAQTFDIQEWLWHWSELAEPCLVNVVLVKKMSQDYSILSKECRLKHWTFKYALHIEQKCLTYALCTSSKHMQNTYLKGLRSPKNVHGLCVVVNGHSMSYWL